MKPSRILILSASTGKGHMTAAHAIQSEAVSRGLIAQTEDVMEHCSPGFRKWYAGGYEQLVRKRPEVWGHLYRTSDRPLFNYWFQTGLDYVFCNRLDRLIADSRPDWVVCTHSLPQPRLAMLRRKVPFKTAVVVTDVYPHRMWLRGAVDRYFVPVEQTEDCLRGRLGRTQTPIDVVGMPIQASFRLTKDRISNGKLTVLLTAGGIGGGPLCEAADELAKLPIHLRIVAGSNAEAYQRLKVKWDHQDQVEVFGLVSQERMADLLKTSDVIVSKPGGLSTFEALASGCAFVVLQELLVPGQEEENARYLVRIGAGVIAKRIADLDRTLGALIDSNERLRQLQNAAIVHAQPDSAKKIIDSLVAFG